MAQFKPHTLDTSHAWPWQNETLLIPAMKSTQPKRKPARWIVLTAINLLLWIVSVPLIWHFLAR